MATYIVHIDESDERGKALAHFLLSLGAIDDNDYDGKSLEDENAPIPPGAPFTNPIGDEEADNDELDDAR